MRLELIGLKAVIRREILEGAILRVEPAQAFDGADPQVIPVVFQDAEDHRARQTILD
jgi:hypothetical protein